MNVYDALEAGCSWASGGIVADSALVHRVEAACLTSTASMDVSSAAALAAPMEVDTSGHHSHILPLEHSLSTGAQLGGEAVSRDCVLRDLGQEGSPSSFEGITGLGSGGILLVEKAWEHREALLQRGPSSGLERMLPGSIITLVAFVKHQAEAVYFGLLGQESSGNAAILADDGSNLIAFRLSRRMATQQGCAAGVTRALNAIARYQGKSITGIRGSNVIRTPGGLSVHLCCVHVRCESAAEVPGATIEYPVCCVPLGEQDLVPAPSIVPGAAGDGDASGLGDGSVLGVTESSVALAVGRTKRAKAEVNYAAFAKVSRCGLRILSSLIPCYLSVFFPRVRPSLSLFLSLSLSLRSLLSLLSSLSLFALYLFALSLLSLSLLSSLSLFFLSLSRSQTLSPLSHSHTHTHSLSL